MKETLILGNHPQTLVIAPHVLRLLSEEKAVALTVPVIAAMFHIVLGNKYDALPITASQAGSTRMYDVFIRAFMTLYTKVYEHPYKENPIETAGDLLASGRNILLFPSGKVYKDVTKPEKWRSGVGRIVRHAYTQNTAINVAMLHILDRKNAELSQPFPIESLNVVPNTVSDSYADSKQISQNLWQFYHAYFGMDYA